MTSLSEPRIPSCACSRAGGWWGSASTSSSGWAAMAEGLPARQRPRWVRRDLADATGRGVRIAVIDSGRDPGWREARIRPGIGFVDPRDELSLQRSADDRDRIGHGTACCDIILGLAPGVELLPARVFGHRLETSSELIVAALEWAVEQRVDLVNLSLGTHLESSLRPLYSACEKAGAAGVVIVSAVHLEKGWSYPAGFANVLGVQAGRFANVFDYEVHPGEAAELVAQGERKVRWLGAQRRRVFGSSLAAPHITAIAALLRERFPGSDLASLRRRLAGYARPSSDQAPSEDALLQRLP